MSREFRLKKTDETRNYLPEEKNQNELMNRKHKYKMKEEIKILKTKVVHRRFQSIYKTMLSYCLKCRKNTESKNLKVARKKTEE